MAKIDQQVKEMKEGGSISPNELEPEKAYDPKLSIYDTLSCETFEKLKNKKINRKEKNKLQEEQQRIDQETFGYNYDNRRQNNNYNTNNHSGGNYQKRRYYNNGNNTQNNTRTKNNTTRSQYPSRQQGYTQKQQNQGKKFRPVNKEQQTENISN